MAQVQQQQQGEMLQSLQKMQADMVRQQLEAEEKAQKSAQEHELKIMQVCYYGPFFKLCNFKILACLLMQKSQYIFSYIS